jgi:hypothetical protein
VKFPQRFILRTPLETCPENRKGATGGPRLVNFSLYIQNIKLSGVKWQSFELYILNVVSGLGEILRLDPLDKKSG